MCYRCINCPLTLNASAAPLDVELRFALEFLVTVDMKPHVSNVYVNGIEILGSEHPRRLWIENGTTLVVKVQPFITISEASQERL